jgi:hypothetical protein
LATIPEKYVDSMRARCHLSPVQTPTGWAFMAVNLKDRLREHVVVPGSNF